MSNKIKALRESSEMSREELAYKTGVSLMTIYSWEKQDDLKALSYERLEKLAKAFNTSIEKILSVE